MVVDPRRLLPQDKSDLARARMLIALGYPTVAPVLPDLLTWLKDCNWPVSRPISDFLATLPSQMAPLVWEVLRGEDYIWKYWCISRLVRTMPVTLAEQFRSELTRLANQPTTVERSEDLHEVAQDALQALWPHGNT